MDVVLFEWMAGGGSPSRELEGGDDTGEKFMQTLCLNRGHHGFNGLHGRNFALLAKILILAILKILAIMVLTLIVQKSFSS